MKSLLFCLATFGFLLPVNAFAAEIDTELHYAFRVQCPSAPIPDPANQDPFDLDPEATATPEPCEPIIPYDRQTQTFVLGNATLNKEVLIDLFVINPRQEMITSVRAKLKFDATKVGVAGLDTTASAFPLSAPGENDINVDMGTITIGRSLTGGSRSEAEFYVGTIRVVPYVNNASLEFLNYQTTDLADTGIYFTSGITSENRLPQAPKPIIFGNASSQARTSPIPTPAPIGGDEDLLPASTPPPSFPPPEETALRPTGLRVQTDEAGNIRLVWPIAPNPPVKGYYLYYGQKSGFYLRRRDVGRTNFAVFPDLPKGQKYYFAITAYDTSDQESDYSDEVSVIIGQPGSESHGFLGDPRDTGPVIGGGASPTPYISPNLQDIGSVADTGPEHLFFFLLISFGCVSLIYSLRRR